MTRDDWTEDAEFVEWVSAKIFPNCIDSVLEEIISQGGRPTGPMADDVRSDCESMYRAWCAAKKRESELSIPDWPLTWDRAYRWANFANRDKPEFGVPKWKWDCGFKLDFDGPLLRVYSRFYKVSAGWRGSTDLMIGDETVIEEEFICGTREELRQKVELKTEEWTQRVKELFTQENEAASEGKTK